MAFLVEYTEPQWRNLNMRALKLDEAYFYVQSFFNKTTYLYSLSEKCYTCPFSKERALPILKNIHQISNDALKLDVSRALKLIVLDKDVGPYALDNQSLCSFNLPALHEFGVYNLSVAANGSCSAVTDKEGVSVNIAFLTVFMITAMFLLLLKFAKFFWKRYDKVGNDGTPATSIGSPSLKVTNNRKRMKSLDGFRGMVIVLMIFVNSSGGKYWWMEHTTWNGLHVADIVFPSFLWIMGVCIPISIKVHLTRGATKGQICKRIIWRSIKLFFIGMCLNSINGVQFSYLRIMGELQRAGIAYLVCGLVHTILFKNHYYTAPPQSRLRSIFYDICAMKVEFLIMLSLIVIYFGINYGLEVPGCPKGYLGPGGKDNYGSYPNCVMGGATGYIDFKVLGSSHMYQFPKTIYNSTVFDPSGIFGCGLTIVQVFFGILAGVIILEHSDWKVRIKRWLRWSLVLAIIGGSLAGFSTENGWIPVNKNLWSLSFVFVTVSFGFCALSLTYYIIDIREWWNGYPFVETGKNSIFMFVCHMITYKMLPWHWRVAFMNTHFVLLLESAWSTMLWVFIALYLDSPWYHSYMAYYAVEGWLATQVVLIE